MATFNEISNTRRGSSVEMRFEYMKKLPRMTSNSLEMRDVFNGLCSLLTLMAIGCSDVHPETESSSDGDSPFGFSQRIKPIMAKFCFECHGGKNIEAGLDLRTIESMLKGGEGGPVLVSGKPEESLLFKLVHKGKMPPDGEMPSTADIEHVRKWIVMGAQP